MVNPSEFIPVAESTGLIVPLGRWVLVEACRQAQSWRLSGHTDDAFYITRESVGAPAPRSNLIDDVAAALEDSGLPASALVLEVTESIIMDDLDIASLACML